MATVNRYFGWFLAVALAFSLFAALRYYLVTWLGERVVADGEWLWAFAPSSVPDQVIRPASICS